MHEFLVHFVATQPHTAQNHTPCKLRDRLFPVDETRAHKLLWISSLWLSETHWWLPWLLRQGKQYPFDSINKLYFLGNKAEDAAEREWLFIAIDDLHQADKLRHGELAATVLKKKGTQCVDVFMFKRKLLNDLLHARIRQLGLSKESSSTLHTVLQSHSSYRNCIGSPDMKSGDATWNAHLSRACMMYCQLIEELVYGTYYDQVIKQILKYLGKTFVVIYNRTKLVKLIVRNIFKMILIWQGNVIPKQFNYLETWFWRT